MSSLKLRFLLLVVLLSLPASGMNFGKLHAAVQSAAGIIEGKVIDASTREPMSGASVRLVGTPFGDACNARGEFRIEQTPAGAYTLRVTFLGYEPTTAEVQVKNGETLRLNLTMKEAAVQAKEVEVVAKKRRQEQSDVRSSVFNLAPQETKVLAGGVEDVLRSLQALPGVLARSELSSELIVRGSGPDQNLMLMDDIEILNPYRLYGTISMFNPETVSDITLLTGGFPAKYGDRLSAVLDITNRNGTRARAFATELNLNLTNGNLIAEGASPFGLDGSWIFSARRTYYDLIVGPILRGSQNFENVSLPNFTDFQSKLAFTLAPEHRIQLSAVTSRDAVDIRTGEKTSARPSSINAENSTTNSAVGLAWQFTPEKSVSNKVVASWYRNAGNTSLDNEFVDGLNYSEEFLDSLEAAGGDPNQLSVFAVESRQTYDFTKWSLKDELSFKLPRHLFEAGAGADYLTTSIYYFVNVNENARAFREANPNSPAVRGFPNEGVTEQTKSYGRVGAYVQDRFELIPYRLFVQPGVRADYYGVNARAYLSPRFNLSYALNASTTLRGAAGLYYQSPGYEKFLTQSQSQFLNLFQGDDFIKSIRSEQATHYVVGVDRWLNEKWQLRGEAYYKRFNDVIVRKKELTAVQSSSYLGGDAFNPANWSQPSAVTQAQLTTTPVNDGTGGAYGVELLLAKVRTSETANAADDRVSGYVSYGLAVAERQRDGLTVPFDYDQRHTINFVGNYKLTEWLDFGVRWQFGSGFPFTAPLGAKPRIVRLDETGETYSVQRNSQGQTLFDLDLGSESNLNASRYPAYHRLDLRLTASAQFWSAQWAFYLDVVNAYNRQNVIGYNYDIVRGDGDLPVIQRSATTALPLVPSIGINAAF